MFSIKKTWLLFIPMLLIGNLGAADHNLTGPAPLTSSSLLQQYFQKNVPNLNGQMVQFPIACQQDIIRAFNSRDNKEPIFILPGTNITVCAQDYLDFWTAHFKVIVSPKLLAHDKQVKVNKTISNGWFFIAELACVGLLWKQDASWKKILISLAIFQALNFGPHIALNHYAKTKQKPSVMKHIADEMTNNELRLYQLYWEKLALQMQNIPFSTRTWNKIKLLFNHRLSVEQTANSFKQALEQRELNN